ncbi:hypothetical protein ASE12_13065 [Aeromicrobium sp. Root236]|uniref:hypothetical protein n=1 Tax=Aeromicrobium sp. Root236 TaxID=1736498 RepID=UPI0006FC09BD|nr:hypothetical protein [Aeromicrobium sp. Root236]KRC65603.1 hypothetical protein ASE12_13065 [Aeromicrobium sp. Root236]
MSAVRGLAAAFLLTASVAACGGGSSDDATSKPDSATSSAPASAATTDAPAANADACDMVSDDAVAVVLGVEVVRREPHGKPGTASASCIKGLKRTSDPSGYTYVSVSVLAGGGATLLDQLGNEGGSTPVDGLGDRAVFVPSAGGVFIADGADAVQVQVVKAGKPGSQKDCVTIAEDVMSRRS